MNTSEQNVAPRARPAHRDDRHRSDDHSGAEQPRHIERPASDLLRPDRSGAGRSGYASRRSRVRINEELIAMLRRAVPTGQAATANLRESLVSAVSRELWRQYRGNEVLNRLEAERLVDHILEHREEQ